MNQPSIKPSIPAEAMRWGHPLQALPDIPGFEAGVRVVERGPQVQGPAHFHPGGHEWFHVVSGELLFTNGDQPPKLLGAGEGDYIAPGVIHHGRNPSGSEVVRLVLFYLKPVDQPVLVRVGADGKPL